MAKKRVDEDDDFENDFENVDEQDDVYEVEEETTESESEILVDDDDSDLELVIEIDDSDLELSYNDVTKRILDEFASPESSTTDIEAEAALPSPQRQSARVS